MVLKFLQRLAFDLTNSFASHFEDTTGLFKRIAVAGPQTLAQLDNFAFAVGQTLKNMVNFVTQHLLGG